MEKETNIWDHFYGKYFFSLVLNVRQSLISMSPCVFQTYSLSYTMRSENILKYTFPIALAA